MSEAEGERCIYTLKEGVRIFSGPDEVRFRKGIWSYNEAVLRLDGQDEEIQSFFAAVYEHLKDGGDADADAIAEEVGASAEQLDHCRLILEGLRSQQFLYDTRHKDVTRIVSALLGGNLSGFEEYVGSVRPMLFFADTDYARDAAKTMAKEIGLPLDILDPEVATELANADLTTRTDAIGQLKNTAHFERHISGYAGVLGAVASPNLSLLRNLNRLLVSTEKPLILGLLDGPFCTVLSTLATQTGCFECFEQRQLARLEDTVVYHRFVKESAGQRFTGGGPWFSPPLHVLTGVVLSEGFLYSALSMQHLAGRIVNVYLPLLEIQVGDLLRVPYCPACGFISKAKMNEMYTSSKRLVSDMLERVEIEE